MPQREKRNVNQGEYMEKQDYKKWSVSKPMTAKVFWSKHKALIIATVIFTTLVTTPLLIMLITWGLRPVNLM